MEKGNQKPGQNLEPDHLAPFNLYLLLRSKVQPFCSEENRIQSKADKHQQLALNHMFMLRQNGCSSRKTHCDLRVPASLERWKEPETEAVIVLLGHTCCSGCLLSPKPLKGSLPLCQSLLCTHIINTQQSKTCLWYPQNQIVVVSFEATKSLRRVGYKTACRSNAKYKQQSHLIQALSNSAVSPALTTA